MKYSTLCGLLSLILANVPRSLCMDDANPTSYNQASLKNFKDKRFSIPNGTLVAVKLFRVLPNARSRFTTSPPVLQSSRIFPSDPLRSLDSTFIGRPHNKPSEVDKWIHETSLSDAISKTNAGALPKENLAKKLLTKDLIKKKLDKTIAKLDALYRLKDLSKSGASTASALIKKDDEKALPSLRDNLHEPKADFSPLKNAGSSAEKLSGNLVPKMKSVKELNAINPEMMENLIIKALDKYWKNTKNCPCAQQTETKPVISIPSTRNAPSAQVIQAPLFQPQALSQAGPQMIPAPFTSNSLAPNLVMHQPPLGVVSPISPSFPGFATATAPFVGTIVEKPSVKEEPKAKPEAPKSPKCPQSTPKPLGTCMPCETVETVPFANCSCQQPKVCKESKNPLIIETNPMIPLTPSSPNGNNLSRVLNDEDVPDVDFDLKL